MKYLSLFLFVLLISCSYSALNEKALDIIQAFSNEYQCNDALVSMKSDTLLIEYKDCLRNIEVTGGLEAFAKSIFQVCKPNINPESKAKILQMQITKEGKMLLDYSEPR